MRGIEYLVDDSGRKRAVVISLRAWGKQWERVRDALVSGSVKDQPARVGAEGHVDIETAFHRLAEEWRRETGHLSSITAKSVHPAYQRMIGMGRDVVPLILHDLEREPDHWFWALSAITGEDPIPSEHAGDMDKMAADWIRFGKDRGYL